MLKVKKRWIHACVLICDENIILTKDTPYRIVGGESIYSGMAGGDLY